MSKGDYGLFRCKQLPQSGLILLHKKPQITLRFKEATTRFELVIEVLQTFALPLGYVAIFLIAL